ncbi:hypothetical protein B0H10DRAFT_1953551 [Mycena sp. CBHHK59/15]|nr:hypothetical protein B0H10DRAFT_1953551 [Mycena sp. CBHHK59/15]
MTKVMSALARARAAANIDPNVGIGRGAAPGARGHGGTSRGRKLKPYVVKAKHCTGTDTPQVALSGPGLAKEIILMEDGVEVRGYGVLDATLNGEGNAVGNIGFLQCLLLFCLPQWWGIVACDEHRCQKAMCDSCLDHPSKELLNLQFICPPCHCNAELVRRGLEGQHFVAKPYEDGRHIILKDLISTRSISAGASSRSVLLLVYCLEGLPLGGTPIPMLTSMLELYFPGNFAFISITFNLGVEGGLQHLASQNQALAKSLTHGSLKSVRRVFTIIVSHSDPHGDIHFAPDNQWAQEPKFMMEQFLSPFLTKALVSQGRWQQNNLLAVLTCGAVVTVPSAVTQLQEFLISSTRISSTLAWALVEYWEATPQLSISAVMVKLQGAMPGLTLFGHPSGHSDLRAKTVKLGCKFCSLITIIHKPHDLVFTLSEEAEGIWCYRPLDLELVEDI